MRPLPRIVVRVLALLSVLLALPIVLAPPAEGFVYWGTDGAIGRAGLDGFALEPGFITGLAARESSVAVDGSHVYWAETLNDTIGRANLDGSGVDQGFIAAPFPAAVAVDSTHIYWTPGFTGAIGRANLDGSGVDENFVAGTDLPAGIAVDSTHIYWTNFGGDSVGRAALDGSGSDPSFIAANDPWGLAVGSGHIYWANRGGSTIARADLDGSGVDQSFISGASDPFGVAVDGAHVYWANNGTGTIGRANLDGTGVNQSFISGGSSPFGLAVGDGTFPETTITSGPEGLTNDASPSFAFASDTFGSTFECRLDSGVWDACNSPKSYSHLADGPYTFGVRAATAAATDPSPATRGFTVDTVASGKASAAKSQKQRQKIVVKVRVSAEERLTAIADGRAKVRVNRHRNSFKLAPKTDSVSAGQTKILKLGLRRKRNDHRIARPLGRGKKASARLTVTLTDRAGNSKTEKLGTKLTR